MSNFLKNSIILLILSFCNIIQAQVEKDKNTSLNSKWFVGVDYGVQMSGIKNEDFVPSNYSPVYKVSIGKWITPDLALTAGYQGRYFRTISSDERFTYNFYSVEAVLNVRNFFSKEKRDRLYNFFLHAGPGYFYHFSYGRGNIHGNMGASHIFSMSDKIKLKFDVSAIIGWDIYQGDEDILPNISVGIIHQF